MESDDNNYLDLWLAWGNRQSFSKVYSETLKEMATELSDELRAATSCLALGPGPGDPELEFIEQCLPNVKMMTIVEQDAKCAAQFQHNLERCQPKVKIVVHNTSIESWKGEDAPPDIVFMFRSLYQYPEPQRQVLFHELYEKCLSPGGYVVIIENSPPENEPDAMHIFGALNPDYALEDFKDIRRNMLAAGFQLEQEKVMNCIRDIRNPSEGLLKLHNHLVGNTVTLEKVRKTFVEMFPDGIAKNVIGLGIFRKPPAMK